MKEEIDPFVFFDDDILEHDVRLTEGAIRAIIKQKGYPDEDGFMECNPDEVELCAMDIKERRYRLKRGLTADSGVADPVIPKRMVNAKKIRPSPGSRRGLHYVSATDHRIPNVGEISLEFQTDEGHAETIVFQVADVNKPVVSISDRIDHRRRVLFRPGRRHRGGLVPHQQQEDEAEQTGQGLGPRLHGEERLHF